MAKDSKGLAVNDLESAKKRGAPIYIVVSGNEQVTLELSPRMENIQKAIRASVSSNCYLFTPTGSRNLVCEKFNNRIRMNKLPINSEALV